MDRLLRVAEKIDAGIQDSETTHRQWVPLWDHPLLLESYIAMLRSPEDHRSNFRIIANLLCPQFIRTAAAQGILPPENTSG